MKQIIVSSTLSHTYYFGASSTVLVSKVEVERKGKCMGLHVPKKVVVTFKRSNHTCQVVEDDLFNFTYPLWVGVALIDFLRGRGYQDNGSPTELVLRAPEEVKKL